MSRQPRVSPVDVPQHIIQRGNNRHVCFASEKDFKAYANWLKEYSVKFAVEIHAWVFMTNHIHLLCTPRTEHSISQMMQGLGRQYVRYFNFSYKRTGTLWEGRYKSSLVQEEGYLLHLYRYIELNPVRAKMVTEPADYFWSSHQINALGKVSDLCTEHPIYLALGNDKAERLRRYRGLFKEYLTSDLLAEIRDNTNSGLVIGNDKFKREIEALTGRRMSKGKRGRPVGWRKRDV